MTVLKLMMAALPFLLLTSCVKVTQAPILFEDAAVAAGLNFTHVTGATGEYFLPEIMGPGVALIDYDNDGDLDIYLIQGKSFDGKVGSGNRLFCNQLKETGKLSFVDVTEQAGVGFVGDGMGVAVGDYDNDGFADIYVTNFGPNVLFHNNGNGTFTDVTKQAGVNDPRWSTSAAFVDYDKDGLLDLFVLNYVDFTVEGNKPCFSTTGERDYCTPKAYHPVPARLFHNQGGGVFTDVTEKSGISNAYGPGLGVVTGDFNGDGWDDLYVANDTAANLLWLNQKDGTFREEALRSGAAYASDGVARAGMGVTAGDFDGDGHDDILVTNLTREGATLFRGNGKGDFDDTSLKSGLAQLTSRFTGFGTKWFDFDNDGKLDLFIANGAVTRMETQRGKPRPFEQTNQLFQNVGGTLREVSAVAGNAFQVAGVARGAAFGDIDNDGRIDIVVANNEGPVRLLLNRSAASMHWLQVQLDGGPLNRFGVGAKVELRRKGVASIWRRVSTDSSYLSAHDSRVHFGLGNQPEVEELIVHWTDGSKESFAPPKPDQIIQIRKATGKLTR